MSVDKKPPRNFFLNEKHEITRGEKRGGGRAANYAPTDWGKRGDKLRVSLEMTKKVVDASKDPLKDRRFFMMASPEKSVSKRTTAKGKPPIVAEETHYSGEHSRVFRRLGLDLLNVLEDGSAIVHSTPERVDQLTSSASHLADLGAREQARWATISGFSPIPDSYRIDMQWVESIQSHTLADMVVELQPLLSGVEADEVMRAVSSFLDRSSKEALTGSGTDFSGRQWFRGRAGRKALLSIAKHLFSIDAVHQPLSTPVNAATRGGVGRHSPLPAEVNTARINQAPVVAVVDCGVSNQHPLLAPYARGQFIEPGSAGLLGQHGSRVASRVVFGDLDFSAGLTATPLGTCRFLDVIVSDDETHINAKSVIPAMEAVVANFPDVRVFNLSFGSHRPLDQFSDVDRRQTLIQMRDLDNFVVSRDVIVVVAAGNSPQGVVPTKQYPAHGDDPQWQLGSWSMGFNTLTCGAMVGRAHPNGLAREVGFPSPFTRVGPGICGAPVPEFAASGGDCTPTYGYASPLGVFVCAQDGTWEDHPGSSFAAPLLAREAAFAFQKLQAICQPTASPFGATVKAFLAATASRPNLSARMEALADRTIGYGEASASRLDQPLSSTALFVWQGVLEGPKDVARIQIPIPQDWLAEAEKPSVKLTWAWDVPVHDAVVDLWACRKVTAVLKPREAAPSLRGTQGKHKTYPLVERKYDLRATRLKDKSVVTTSDLWLIEISYEEIAEYAPGIEFSPQQRVGLIVELADETATPISPQAFVQRLPIAATMVQLGVPRTRITSPVVIKIRH